MNKFAKRLIGLFMLSAFFSMFSSSALAAYSTYEGSIATYHDFRNGTNNTIGYDADGYYDRQCWDGVQVFYRRLGMSLSTGNVYNSEGKREGYAKHCWDDASARAANTGSQFTQITRIEDVRRGDVIVFSGPYYTGHIGFADENNDVSKGTITVWGQNQVGDGSGYYFTAVEFSKSYFLGAFRYKGWNADVRGAEMSQGFDRAIPDGDYLIAAAGTADKSKFYYLDIEGMARPASNDTNVSLCGPLSGDPPVYEIWTVTYNSSDKFYTIAQKGTNMCLDVYCADTLQGTNVQVYTGNNSSAQKWAIERNGSSGYRIRPKCSGGGENGMCLDISGGSISNGTQVRQWKVNNSDAQSWLFIPYQPQQPVAEGRYIFLYSQDMSYELDVAGDTGAIDNNTNIQLWADTAPSEYNSFDIVALSNGYYKIRHAASGKCLDVTNGSAAYKANVAVHDDNGSIAQQWAIMSNGAGYSIVSRCNGYALDLPNGITGSGKNVEVYPRLDNDHQRWSFVRAEYAIHYKAAEGEHYPEDQVKYYRADLTLSSTKPTRSGYEFVCWEDILSLDENLNTDKYYPGDVYTLDESLELYPVWRQVVYDYTITYDANGGEGAPAAQHVTAPTAILTSVQPHRSHYSFSGWATASNAAAAIYQPGDLYAGNADITLYAVWKHKTENLIVLPPALSEIESEAFAGTAADAFVIPATVTAIGNNAFDDVVIYGYSGSRADSYAAANGLTFISITDQWVPENAVPAGAHVTDNKWTYTLITSESTASTATAMEGWTQAGFTWQESGTGTWKYAGYPTGFDTESGLYGKYNKAALAEGETSTGDTTKRVVDAGSSFVTYIYWHWTFVDSLNSSGDSSNVLVEDAKKYNVKTGNVYRDYIYFDAFEDPVDHGTWGPGANGQINVDPMRYAWRNDLGDVSHWWWIFEVRQQTYTDYQKVFTYIKESGEIMESSTEVAPGDGITNIQHWVKYTF